MYVLHVKVTNSSRLYGQRESHQARKSPVKLGLSIYASARISGRTMCVHKNIRRVYSKRIKLIFRQEWITRCCMFLPSSKVAGNHDATISRSVPALQSSIMSGSVFCTTLWCHSEAVLQLFGYENPHSRSDLNLRPAFFHLWIHVEFIVWNLKNFPQGVTDALMHSWGGQGHAGKHNAFAQSCCQHGCIKEKEKKKKLYAMCYDKLHTSTPATAEHILCDVKGGIKGERSCQTQNLFHGPEIVSWLIISQ